MKSESIGIVMLMPSGWGDVWTGRHQIAARLSQEFPLVWVSPPEPWRDAFTRPRRPRFTPADGAESIDVYTPPRYLPHVYRPQRLQDLLLKARLRQAVARLRSRGVTDVVLYIWRPAWARALDLLGHRLSVYHVNDEYSFGAADEAIGDEELQLLRRADQVIIHSPELMRRKGGINPHTTMIPNGVDFGAFSSPVDAPPEFDDIPRPRIGYVGWLKRHLDWDTLERLVAAHPSYSFVFVGPRSPHSELDPILARLEHRRNVWLLGRQPATRLPAYVQQLDVCLLPYVDNAYTRCIYPLKVHEYLAAGLPVVGTALPSLELLRSVVQTVKRPEEWDSALAQALGDESRSAAQRERRQDVARSHDWDVLVARIRSVILEGLMARVEKDRRRAGARAQ